MSVITFPLFNQNAPFLFDQENMQAIAPPKSSKTLTYATANTG